MTWLGQLRRNAEDARRAQAAMRELTSYFETALSVGSGSGHNLLHLMRDIVQSEPGTTVEDLYAQRVLLLVAGHETTRNLIGNGPFTLLTHPEALRDLREAPDLISPALEEILRCQSPVQALGRATLIDIEIQGVHLPAHSSITLGVGGRSSRLRAHREP